MIDRRRTVPSGRASWGFSLLMAAALCLGQARAQKVECDKVSVHLYPDTSKPTTTRAVVINPELNSSLVLTCSSDGTPDGFTWFRSGQEIPSASSSQYRIDKIKSSDGGEYQCVVDVKRCDVRRKSNKVVVNTPPAISEIRGEPRVVEAGSSFTLTCLASGWPTPHIKWSVGSRGAIGGSSYTVPSAQLADSGDYVCTAWNSRGNVSSTYTVTVQGHPPTKGHDLKQGAHATTKQQLRSVAAYDSTATTGPENKRGGSLGSATFIAIIVVCVLLGVAMVVVIIIVSIILCCVSMKSCKNWFDSRRTGDKAHLIPPESEDDTSIGEMNGRATSSAKRNGSTALAGVAAALTGDGQEESKTEAKKKKKKKPKAGFKSKKVQPQEDSDEVPIITNIDDPWQEESEEDEQFGMNINAAGKSTALVVVENGVKREDSIHASQVQVEESAISKSSAAGDGSPKVQVEAEVMPEMVAMSVIAQQAEQDLTASGGVSVLEGQKEDTAAAESKESLEKQEEGGGEGVGTIEEEGEPVVVIQGSDDPVMTVEIQNGHEEMSPLSDPPTESDEKTEEELLGEKAKKLGRSMSFVKQLSRSRPLGVTEISQLVYGQDDGDGGGYGASGGSGNPLFAEYNSIPQNTPVLDQSPAEKSRNRYRNVLPNAHSAVKLNDIGEDGSTYINANYIQGYKKENAYIVTQGPIADTMPDFWRMVWEKNVSIIVMLTGIIERGRHKCAKYWPYPGSNEGTGEQDYGSIRVRNNFEETGQDYNVTNLTISNNQQGAPEEREVYHFAYKAWPDFGVPKESNSLLDLVEVVNNYRKQQPDFPIIVHCSAGLGRSGAFMAIDMGIHQCEQEGQVDPLKYFCDMRSDRGGTIQTPEQYVFIHKALADYMMARMK